MTSGVDTGIVLSCALQASTKIINTWAQVGMALRLYLQLCLSVDSMRIRACRALSILPHSKSA